MHIGILGAGMVGRAIALDLAAQHDVTSFDVSEASLNILQEKNKSVKTIKADLRDFSSYPALLSPFDIVVSAVPGFMGFETLRAVITAGRDVVDISFFPENALELGKLAAENNVTAIVDCGVAPGMSNLILGHYNAKMQISHFECMVGGLPKTRLKPFEYKAPFSPVDVLEEYSRPARYVENGALVTRPALSDPELIDFKIAGTLESFNTDGLRSLIYTMPHIPNMKEKTLRYPGHISLIASLQKAGFFDTREIRCGNVKLRPIDFTSALLFDQWKLSETDEEFTIMKILIRGKMNDRVTEVEYFLYDEKDPVSLISSMSRTTGYACTAAVSLVANRMFNAKGVFPPELVGHEPGCFQFIMDYLGARGIVYDATVIEMDGDATV